MSKREGRGDRLARREESAYPVVRNRRATPPGGMDRPSKRTGYFGAGPKGPALLALLLLAAATIPAVWQVSRLRSVHDVEQFFPVGDPEVEQYHRFRDAFGLRDTSVLLLLTGEEVFQAKPVETVRRLTATLSDLDGVEQVTSLTNAVEIRTGAEGEMVVAEPLGLDYGGAATLASIRGRLLKDPLFVGRLISRDGRTTCILLRLDAGHALPSSAARMEEAIREEVKRSGGSGGFQLLLGGAPLVRARYTKLIQRDMRTFLPLVLGLFALLLLLIFRSPRGVILPLACVALAAIWTLGGFAFNGGTMTTLTSLVPVLLLVIGLSDAVHFLARYERLTQSGESDGPGDKEASLRKTLRQVGGACVITTITTATGFLALVVSNMRAVRTFGAIAAAGVLAALVATVAFLPTALALLPKPRPRNKRSGARLTARMLSGVGKVCTAKPWRVLAAVAVVLAVSGVGAARISRDIRLYGNLPEGHPLLAAERFADRNLGGALTVEVLLDAGKDGGAATSAAVGELMRLERYLVGLRSVNAVRSMLDPLRATHRVLSGETTPLPARGDLISQYLLLLSLSDQDPSEPYIDFSRRRARLSIQLPDLPQSKMLPLLAGLSEQARKAPSGLKVSLTGSTALLHRVYRELVDGMLYSFALAFGVILLLIWGLLRSLRLALVSMVPNLAPLLMTLGFMGWAGIPLAPTTSLVFAVALGIAVDDTIHFLAHYRRCRREGQGADEAVRDTLMETGRPIIWTSFILAGGFSVLLASSFLGNVYFGLILAVTMLAALLADLLLLPAMLVLVERGLLPSRDQDKA